jgi:hypothetical protein
MSAILFPHHWIKRNKRSSGGCALPIISVAAGLPFVPTGSLTVHTLLPIAAAIAGLVVIAIIVIFELRKTPAQEEEMIRREDDVISDVPDDPHQPARWVP